MKVIPKSALAAIALCTVVGASASAGPDSVRIASLPPQSASTINIAYDLSFWGLNFGHTSFNTRFLNGAYSTASTFTTSGLVSAFWQSTIDATSSGNVGDHRIEPTVYDSYYRRSEEKKQRVKLSWDNSGQPELTADPPYKTNHFPVAPEQKKGALDPMSAVVYVISAARADAKNPCGTVAPVFDGRRRYDIDFTYVRDEQATVGNLYKGTAHLCQLRYNQIAGFKPKIISEGKSFPPIFGWFVEVPSPNAPNGKYLVALKVWAQVSWGTVTAQLSDLEINGTKPKV